MKWMIHNGVLKKEMVRISVKSRPVAYGDGCFETLRSYKSYFLELDKHIGRLNSSMSYLDLNKPESLSPRSIKKQIQQLLGKNEMVTQPSVVRIQVWREGGLGYQPEADAGINWIITASELPEIDESISLAQVPTRRIPSAALNSSFKLSNGINYIRASMEADKLGADDALMLTMDDFVSETTIANIFWHKDDIIYTPNLECDILPGITRAILSDIIRNQTDYKLVKGKYTMTDLKESDTVWVCNSVREILPVHAVGEATFQVESPVINQLKSLFNSYKKQQLESLTI